MPNALIWGASGSIGSALVRHLHANGWTVYGAARNTAAIPAEATEQFTFDAAQPQTFRDIALMLAQDSVELDLVVYAAGGMQSSTLEKMEPSAWQAVMDANLHGAYLGVNAVLHLVPKGGHVVIIGAYVDKITLPKFGAYAAAKAALEPMTAILARENRRKHITLVRPPAVQGAFWQNVPFDAPDYAITPETVAEKIFTHVSADGNGVLDI
jgi:3-oxoacyl-[acyl-carrier protein] reductase